MNTLLERVRQGVAAQGPLLDDEIQQRQEEATQLISAGLKELRSTAPDGSALSNLLRKVADRVSGDPNDDPPK